MPIVPEFDGTNGYAVALARIAEEAEVRTGRLDLRKLNLVALPPDLARVGHLETLDCSDNPLASLDGLQHCPKLQSLDCWATEITSLDGLQHCPELLSLTCWGTQISDLDGLQYCPELKHLNCSRTQIKNFDGLQHCPELRRLDCSSTKIKNLIGMQNCQNLQSFDCSDTEIANLNGLLICKKLQNFACYRTKISSLCGIQYCTQLRYLGISYNQIESLNWLDNCQQLQYLDCSDTKITALEKLQNCPDLRHLVCSFNAITSLDGLQYCPGLRTLDCSWTSITNLSPLSACLELKKLEALGVPLTEIPPGFWDRPALEDVKISSLNGVPRELLSESYVDNCLQRLRNYLTDLETGRELIRDVKLFLLGNGGTGKTQMARHLRREAFNPGWDSTHGIQVTTAILTGDEDHPESTNLHLWDFGGQELYHSTHALFLRSRALFLLLWSPDMEPETAETLYSDPLDYLSRNYPRSYWFDQIADHAGTDSPVLRVQSKCETHQNEQPLSLEEGQRFAFFRALAFGAANGYRARDLKSAIRDGLDDLRETTGESYIGQSWTKVQRAIEALRAADGTYPPENQLRSRDWFRDLCAEKGVKTGDAAILTYLHRCGILFYRPGLFGDQIIIDQAWAINAIYALFDRDKLPALKQKSGRFTADDLAKLLWNKAGFSSDEQALFLSFMETCGICFVYQDTDTGPVYLAPDLLPDRKHVAAELAERWDIDGEIKSRSFDYPMLHRGILRTLICRIGAQAQMRAIYWRDGLYVYEETTRSRARIDQDFTQGPHPWAGTLTISVKGAGAEQLLDLLSGWVEEINATFGIRPSPAPPPRQPEAENTLAPVFGEEPGSYYVSYAWKDVDATEPDKIAAVQEFIAEAERRSIPIRQDTSELSWGDSLTKFMDKLAHGQKIFIILSDAYLRSPNCTYELFKIWQNCAKSGDIFTNRVRIYLYPGLKIFTDVDRLEYFDFWQSKYHEIKKVWDRVGPENMPVNALLRYHAVREFHLDVMKILEAVSDRLQPKNWDEFINYSFDDLAPLTPQTASPPPRTAPPRP